MNSGIMGIVTHLVVAVFAGGLIGLERSYFGRPAGLRTHTLVCMASSLLMLVTIYHREWFAGTLNGPVTIDPTRMAQGIMTGIGFLGAGVIMKERLSVRGLTTAASIWITAAIGILAGVGMYATVAIVTALTLGTLTLYRIIERNISLLTYLHHTTRFLREKTMPEAELRELITSHGFTVVDMGYTLTNEGKYFEYNMIICTRRESNIQRLAKALTQNDTIVEFRISPATG